MKPKPIYRASDQWVLGICNVCKDLNYVEPHGTDAHCSTCRKSTEHSNIPQSCRDVSGCYLIKMPDDREFLPDTQRQGLWNPNPNFSGNRLELFKHYPVTLLKDFRKMHGGNVGDRAVVRRVPSGQLYLKMDDFDRVFCDDAKEGIDFKLI